MPILNIAVADAARETGLAALDPEDICHVSSDPSRAEPLLRSRVAVAVVDGHRSQPDLDLWSALDPLNQQPVALRMRCLRDLPVNEPSRMSGSESEQV